MANVIISGSVLSDGSGDADRTYTMTDSDFVDTNTQIFVNGVYLYVGASNDYTISGSVITFLNNTFDDQIIDIRYETSVSASATTSYGSSLQLAQFMGIESVIPDRNLTGEDRVKEEVGEGDASNLIFYLDHAFVLAGSYTLYYGSTESSATALTETTHYVLGKDDGKITLTTAGRTLLSTNTIYAAYSYTRIGLTNTQLSDALLRASENIDAWTNNHFVDGTVATPTYDQHLDEENDGRGAFQNSYFTLNKYPIPDVSTTVDGAITADDATITVASTSGFPSTGYILIEDDKIAYTGKSSTTFTGCTSVSAHDDALDVKAYVIEVSTTEPGGDIDWDVMSEGDEFEIDRRTGRISLYGSAGNYFGRYVDAEGLPIDGVPNRFRVSYLTGNSTIPYDIVKLTLMLASQDLMNLAVRSAHLAGLNDFNPSVLKVDQETIDKIISSHKNEMYLKV